MKRQFIIERDGKSFVLYAGLLDAAHEQGLESIETDLIQVPAQANGEVAICRARVVTAKGSFVGLGDAAPDNVPAEFTTCLIRMAETRAKARALRDAVNVGMASFEELPGLDEVDLSDDLAYSQPTAAEPEPPPINIPKEAATCDECGKTLTLPQTQLSMVAFGMPLCPKCQQSRRKAGAAR
jgi:hypothetical protein